MTLKPCPFCGGDPEYTDAKVIYGKDHAYCHGCKAEVPVKTWNRRVETPRPEAGWIRVTDIGEAEYVSTDGKMWRYQSVPQTGDA